MKKVVFVIALVLVCVLVMAGCGGTPQVAKPAKTEGATAFEVEGSCEASLSGDTLVVSGTANLMDGTNGVISVLNADGTSAANFKFTKQGNSISHEFPVEESWQDVVYGFIMFDTEKSDKQPNEVKDAYGSKFENLEGPQDTVIWDSNGVIAIFQSEEVTIR